MKEFDPGEAPSSIVSITDRVKSLPLGAAVGSVHFLGDRAFFVGAEESVAIATARRRDHADRDAFRRHPVRGLRRQAACHRR
ncbi:hypothetical protein ACVWW1_005340 [Bradyrhizobium sp. JR3.5]